MLTVKDKTLIDKYCNHLLMNTFQQAHSVPIVNLLSFCHFFRSQAICWFYQRYNICVSSFCVLWCCYIGIIMQHICPNKFISNIYVPVLCLRINELMGNVNCFIHESTRYIDDDEYFSDEWCLSSCGWS